MARAVLNKDEHSRYLLAEKLTQLVYRRYKFSEFGRTFLYDDEFIDQYETIQGKGNYRSLDRKYALSQLVKLVDGVEGDTAECGVWRGTSSYFICSMTVGSGKRHHAFDSFQGLSKPALCDGSYWSVGDLACDEESARRTLNRFESVSFHRGWIPDRFPEVAHLRFSFLHIDVDLYEPTSDSLVFFYPRMNPGGIIVCDDYGFSTCPGAARAIDEFFAGKPERIVALPTGQAFAIKKGP